MTGKGRPWKRDEITKEQCDAIRKLRMSGKYHWKELSRLFERHHATLIYHFMNKCKHTRSIRYRVYYPREM